MELNGIKTNHQEKMWVIKIALALFLLTSLPFIIGALVQDDQWLFSGFYFGVEDGNSYVAKMLNGNYGDWLFKTPYSVYPQTGFLAFLPYILLGKLASPPGLHAQLLVLYQFFRLLGAIVMCIGTYKFISFYFDDIRLRRIGTIMGVAGAGFGWLYIMGWERLWGGRIPLEFYSPETFGFLSFMSLPHLSMARGLLLMALSMFLKQMDGQTVMSKWLGGAILLMVGFCQPLTVLVGWVVIGISILVTLAVRVRKKQPVMLAVLIREYAWYYLIPSPLIIYTFLKFNYDPFLSGWASRNIILSPPPTDYLLSYGLFLIVAILAVIKIVKNKDRKYVAIISWLTLVPFLIYFPYNLQRRFAEGSWLVLIVLVCYYFREHPNGITGLRITLGLSLISPLIFFAGGVIGTTNKAYPIYIENSMVALLENVQQQIRADDVVIADYAISNALPAYFNVHTVVGHGPESVNPGLDLDANDELFSGISSPKIREYICRSGGEWVLARSVSLPNQAVLGECCHLIAENEQFHLYQVNQSYCVDDE
ncbi:MAG: hypothetical protein HPY76_04740 [Anaerolineae bacterium]|nr:hypothetical protein [Anaerolineae bacterium]